MMPEKLLEVLGSVPFCLITDGGKVKLNKQRFIEIIIAALIIGWIVSTGVSGLKAELNLIRHELNGLKANVAKITNDFYRPRVSDE